MANIASKKLYIAKTMPPLFHKLPNQKYDVRKSEAIKWLISQPEIMEYIMSRCSDGELIKYDYNKMTWQGVDYEK